MRSSRYHPSSSDRCLVSRGLHSAFGGSAMGFHSAPYMGLEPQGGNDRPCSAEILFVVHATKKLFEFATPRNTDAVMTSAQTIAITAIGRARFRPLPAPSSPES